MRPPPPRRVSIKSPEIRNEQEVAVVGSSYPLLDVMWTMLAFFLWIIWLWLLIAVLADVFRRGDIRGWSKAGWTAFVIVLPFIGVLCYIGSQGDSMSRRTLDERRRVQHGGSGASDANAAAQIATGKDLFDSGAITQVEFDALKQKALA
jgi:hypothetical protein